jgi:transposase-like protein
MKKRKTYSPELKAEAVLKVLKEESTLAQVASKYGIHPVLLAKWKTQFLRDAAAVFRDERKPLNEMKAAHEKQVDELYREVGKLTTRLNWLKKKSGIELE